MWYRFSRREDDYCIECSEDGVTFRQMRICHMHGGKGKIRFGIYACSPEESSFQAAFSKMQIMECQWKAHNGQQPDGNDWTYILEEKELSIAVNIYYRGTDGSARRFAEEMESSGTADAIRREEGNIKYDYFFPMADPETVLLIDCWEDQNALDRHHASPMMEKIMQLREKYDLHMEVERHVPDGNGMPESDRQFVRK